MVSDFLDAHRRHWEDAELLHDHARRASADHLYGVSAECGLKSLMLALGMPFDDSKDQPQRQKDRKHADGIWMRYDSYRYQHFSGTRYSLPPAGNPFYDWAVSQRYANRAHFDKTRVNSHRQATALVRKLVRKATWDGLI
jgi:hypothetical protein